MIHVHKQFWRLPWSFLFGLAQIASGIVTVATFGAVVLSLPMTVSRWTMWADIRRVKRIRAKE